LTFAIQNRSALGVEDAERADLAIKGLSGIVMARPPPIKVYKPVWKCIYCGKDRFECTLGQDHVIPLSLDGRFILPRASCQVCSEITKSFEETCTRTMWGTLRIILGSYTRRPEERPLTLPMIAVVDGREEHIQASVEDYPFIQIVLPKLEKPHLLHNSGWRPNFAAKFKVLRASRRTSKPPVPYTHEYRFSRSDSTPYNPFYAASCQDCTLFCDWRIRLYDAQMASSRFNII
jgi:hypothetical protein